MALPLFDDFSKNGDQQSGERPLMELDPNGQSSPTAERSSFFQNKLKSWGKKRQKTASKLQIQCGTVSKADGHPRSAAWSPVPALRLETVSHASTHEPNGLERHASPLERLAIPDGVYISDQVRYASQNVVALSPTGSTKWDWESPTTLPRYDINFKSGELQRRNAIRRASAHAKASIASIHGEDPNEDPRFERHDSGSILDDSIDVIRSPRSSSEEDSTYFTASARSSWILEEASRRPSEERSWLDFVNAAEPLDQGLRNTSSAHFGLLRRGMQQEPRENDLRFFASSSHSMRSTPPSDVIDRNTVDADRNVLPGYNVIESNVATIQLSPEVRDGNDHAYAEELQASLLSQAWLSREQEARDHALCLRLQQEEDEIGRQGEQANTKTCIICTDELHVLDFAVRPPTMRCDHPVETCHKCLQHWVASEFDSNGWDHIKCPQCSELLDHGDVQAAAEPDVFARYDTLAARDLLSHDPLFHWCIASGCTSGQILAPDSGPTFSCSACGFQHCTRHIIEWHRGETCEQYDYRVSGQKQKDEERKKKEEEEEASRKLMETTTKQCPGPKGKKCGWGIEKNDGCDHMTCRKCRHQFCWVCLADYKEIKALGNTAHAVHCRYHTKNLYPH